VRYIVTLSVPGGWPDQATELQPADIERELRSIFGATVSVQAARTTQSPGANVARYFELEADAAVTPTEINDMLVVAMNGLAPASLLSRRWGLERSLRHSHDPTNRNQIGDRER